MWLAFDVGNSAIKCGLFEGDRLDRTLQLSHESATLSASLSSILEGSRVNGAGIASVVPRTGSLLEQHLRNAGIPVTVVTPSMPLPFRVDYRTPETLGTDRIAAAAAAWVLFGKEVNMQARSVVALDAGTAVTCEVVRRDGVYLGGTIGPGPVLMQRALNRETAQLPEIPLEVPDGAVGRSTVEAIQSGVMYGFIEASRGLLQRIQSNLGEEAYVVSTGGWGELLKEHVRQVAVYEPHLVLKGVRILAERDW